MCIFKILYIDISLHTNIISYTISTSVYSSTRFYLFKFYQFLCSVIVQYKMVGIRIRQIYQIFELSQILLWNCQIKFLEISIEHWFSIFLVLHISTRQFQINSVLIGSNIKKNKTFVPLFQQMDFIFFSVFLYVLNVFIIYMMKW